MSPDEIVILARYVRALAPQQRFDEYTPDAWGDVLGEYQLDDARQAAAAIAKRQPFIAPSEIAREIGDIRSARLEGFQYEPQADDDDPRAYAANLRAQRRAVADGTRPAVVQHAVTGPTVPELLTTSADRGLGTVTGHTRAGGTATGDGPRGVHGVVCPKCAAPIGRPCRMPGSQKTRPPHPRRRAAATGTPVEPTDEQNAQERLTAARRALAGLSLQQRTQILQEAAQ